MAIDDDPELDNTPGAHPAYWRGQDDGVRGTVTRIMAAIEGLDDGGGVYGYPELERARRLVLGLRDAVETLAGALDKREEGAAPCARCGGAAPEFTVPNHAWNTIIRDDGPERPGEYLCLACFANEAADKIRHLVAALHIAAAQIERLGGRPMFATRRPAGSDT